MSFGEDIVKLRQRMADAAKRGLISKDLFEASLIQIMNDAEKHRLSCINQADNLRKQASLFDGQAGAFASVSSIVYNVLNGFVTADEKDEASRLEEQSAKEQSTEEIEEIPTKTKKKIK